MGSDTQINLSEPASRPVSVAPVIGALAFDGPHELPVPAQFTAQKAQGFPQRCVLTSGTCASFLGFETGEADILPEDTWEQFQYQSQKNMKSNHFKYQMREV